MLTYELLLNYLLTSHRKRLHPFASLTDIKPHQSHAASGKAGRRGGHNASVSSMASDVSRVTVTGLMSGPSKHASTASMAMAYEHGHHTADGASSVTSEDEASSMVAPGAAHTPAKASRTTRHGSPGPSPWLSPNSKLTPGPHTAGGGDGTPGHGTGAPAATPPGAGPSSIAKLRKFRHGDGAKSLLDVLRASDMDIHASVVCGVVVDTVGLGHGDVPDGRMLLMSQALRRLLLQTKECLAESRFELRRMADQVLPLLTEVVMWLEMCAKWPL